MLRLVKLTRIGEDGDRVDLFEAAGHVDDPQETLRQAVKDWLQTSEGREVFDDTNGDFNWGDALTYIPPDWWEEYGLTLLDGRKADIIDIEVDQHELLGSELDYEGEESEGDE